MQIKFNKDGPVTFGALGGTYPQMNAQAGDFAVVSGIVRNGVLGPAIGDIVRPDNAASVKITMKDTSATYTADSGVLGDPFHRFGPVLNEYHKAVPLTNHITARWVIQKYVGFDTPVVDLTIENCWAFEPGPQNFQYDVEVTIGGKVVYSGPVLTHRHHGRWRMVFNDYGVTATFPWIGTKAVPPYDTSAVPFESVLQKFGALALQSGPMQIGPITAHMPNTGGRGDIGILPDWAVSWLLSGDDRARACTLAGGVGVGSFSMHYRDKKTDRPVTLTDHPRMTIVGRSTDAGADAFPGPGGDTSTPYEFDIAHQPSLAYIPYLMTGDYFYLEELHFAANYDAFSSNPNYRNGVQGLVSPEQLRGQAWALRSMAQAAFVTPDTDPMKAELVRLIGCNLDWYNATYTNNPNANKIGVLTNGYAIDYDNQTGMAPWMDDFFVSTLGHMIDLGFEKARPLLEWKAKFTLGRMLDVCWIMAASYAMHVRDTSSSPIYDTIDQCFRKALGDDFMALPCASPQMAASWNTKGYPCNLYPTPQVIAGDMGNIADGNMGYPANLQPALAYLVTHNVPRAKEAWALFSSRSVKPDYRNGAQFAIIPVLPVQPPEGNPMTYTVVVSPTTSDVQAPAGSEATPTSTIAEILDADKSTILAQSGVAPYSFPGITFGERFYRLTDYDSKGAVMGTPVVAAFTLPDDTVVTPPADITVTRTTGATVSWTKD